MTTTKTSMRHSARRPARRWYSCAVVSSSAAPAVSTAMEEIFDSMLSGDECQCPAHNISQHRSALTEHTTLLLDKRTEVTEDLMEFVNTSLDLPNFRFPFLDHGLLESKLLRR